MSYAGGTTHYEFPQIVSSDRPTFADFNEAFRTLDTKLYGLEGDATTTDGRLNTLEDKMGTAEGHITDLGLADIRIEGKADANAEAITLLQVTVGGHTTQISKKVDMVAIADEYRTDIGYTIGDVVMYNGQRYVCHTTYTTGEPFDADKWTGEDVQTVLDNLGTPSAVDVSLTPITGMTATNVQDAVAELNEAATGSTLTFTVTADGVKTRGQCLDSLFGQLGATISKYGLNGLVNSQLKISDTGVYKCVGCDSDALSFEYAYLYSTGSFIAKAVLKSSGSQTESYTLSTDTYSNSSSNVVTSGTTFVLSILV